MTFVHDIIICGAGPCGFAVAARLCEQTPAELFTDEEHRRYHWIRKSTGSKCASPGSDHPESSKASKSGSEVNGTGAPVGKGVPETHPGQGLGEYNTLVIDASDKSFLSRWRSYFETFDIAHLRSPMFFQLDPADRDGLLSFAQRSGRYVTECEEIRDVVGKELSKHTRKKRILGSRKRHLNGEDIKVDERDRKDYRTPSRELFYDHCRYIMERYGIDEKKLIIQDVVRDIQFAQGSSFADLDVNNLDPAKEIFQVTTRDGVYYARAVVLAIGPSIPLSNMVLWPSDGACHSSQIREFPSFEVKKKMKMGEQTNILIVGGGLTSAQLALLAIRKGVSKVWLLMRGDLKIKHFDLDLDWIGKLKNQEKAVFWSADTDEERFHMIKQARNGGSIPSKYIKLLNREIAAGKISVHTHTTLRSICERKEGWSTWPVLTEPLIPNLPEMDYVYFATGPNKLNHLSMPNCSSEGTPAAAPDAALPVPFLESLQRQHPIHWLNGLPILTDDLTWSASSDKRAERTRSSIPLFMTGALAALRLGPGAANLEGARAGAERVAWGIQDALSVQQSPEQGSALDLLSAYSCGEGSKFHGLEGLEDDG